MHIYNLKFVILIFATCFQLNICYAKQKIYPLTMKHDDKTQRQIHNISIIGKDERVSVPSNLRSAANGIGWVYDTRQKGLCTAFCVGPNIIASNAHCLIKKSRKSKEIDLSHVYFALSHISESSEAYWRGSTIIKKSYIKKTMKTSQIKYVSKSQPRLSLYAGHYRGGRRNSKIDKDWAFAKITHNICEGNELVFLEDFSQSAFSKIKNYDDLLIGYHGNKGVQKHWLSPDCSISYSFGKNYREFHPKLYSLIRKTIRNNSNLILHDCDTHKGSSGSPIFIKTLKGFRVAAINTGYINFKQYQINRRTQKRRTIIQSRINTAINPRAFLAGLERFKSENLIENLDELRELQTLLKRARLYKSSVDGLYGSGTRAAILNYEKKVGLAPLGIPTSYLMERLRKKFKDAP